MAKLDTTDNIYTKSENARIKRYIRWAVLGPIVGLLFGIGGYIYLDKVLTPAAIVIEASVGTELLGGTIHDGDIAHPANGSFSVVVTEGGNRVINLSDDFAIVHAPDPHVRINGKVIAKVVNYEGAQSYHIPNFIGEITDVKIWCEIADIALGNGVIDGGMDMPEVVIVMIPERTAGLVTLGTTGDPVPYAMEQMGVFKGKVSGAFTDTIREALTNQEQGTNAGFFGYAPEVAIVNGNTFRMVAPAHSPDNFVVFDGVNWYRYDLGVDEGTDTITLVSQGKI